jgi:hypothetical protein
VYLYGENGATIERSRITGSLVGVGAHKGRTTVSGSLIRFGASADGSGISARTLVGYDATVDVDGTTIVGPGLPWT